MGEVPLVASANSVLQGIGQVVNEVRVGVERARREINERFGAGQLVVRVA